MASASERPSITAASCVGEPREARWGDDADLVLAHRGGMRDEDAWRHPKTAWFMLSRLRLALQDSQTGGKLNGEVEADETYIGGIARNMHASKRERLNGKRGRSVAGNTVVMGPLARHGKDGHSTVRTEVLSSLKRDHVEGHVRNHVEAGATVHTDAFLSYAGLDAEYVHNVIDHAECYVDGNVHINGLRELLVAPEAGD